MMKTNPQVIQWHRDLAKARVRELRRAVEQLAVVVSDMDTTPKQLAEQVDKACGAVELLAPTVSRRCGALINACGVLS